MEAYIICEKQEDGTLEKKMGNEVIAFPNSK
jgi:hypothetical protein